MPAHRTLTAWERATGTILDAAEPAALSCFGDRPTAPRRPLDALEDAVRPALRAPGRCFVSFSGGHDSSLVLAVAARVARADGLPLPVPISLRFPRIPGADESDRQDAVLAALGLDERLVVEITDELDVVGPVSRGVLTRNGIFAPSNSYTHEPLYERIAGGHLLLGVGGDELMGRCPRPRRPWPFARRSGYEWLRPGPRRRARRQRARHMRTMPRDPSLRPRWQLEKENVVLAYAAQHTLGRRHGVEVTFPLADRGVVSAVEACGFDATTSGGRTPFMQRLFADELPAALLEHRPKAPFNDVVWGNAAREFVAEWDGTGVDPDIVDVDALRSIWTSPDDVRRFRTMLLVQQCWLAQQSAASSTAQEDA